MKHQLLLFMLALAWNVAERTSLCPHTCSCRTDATLMSEKVDCSKEEIHIIPPVDTWPENASILILSGNNITEVNVEMFHENLHQLKLDHNNINSIVSSAFGGLRNLNYLDLSNNQIDTLEVNLFFGLESLEVLNISHNKVKTVPINIFYNLYALEELVLSSNPIISLEADHFKRTLSLSKLDIADINAYFLQPNLFLRLTELESLDISENDFHKVPTDALRSAQNLRWLRVSENPIDKLDKTSFMRLSTLEVLEINFMDHLETVGPSTFSELTNLRILEMKFNKKLHYIDPNAFKGLFYFNGTRPNLQELSMAYNRLTSLSKEMFPCTQMLQLDLQGNPWMCDCRIQWMRKCSLPPLYTADLKCRDPTVLRGQRMIKVKEEDFTCDYALAPTLEEIHHERVLRTMSLILGCVLLVVLSLSIVIVLKWKSIKGWWKMRKGGTGAVYYVRTHNNPVEA